MDKYNGIKVLILGLGLNEGGLGAARFFAKQNARVRVTDLKPAEELKPTLNKLAEFSGIEYVLGKHEFSDIDWADLIIRNPALRPDNKFRLYAEQSGKRVETDLGIFLEYVRGDQIIGITGTKGKTTTSSLIYEAIKDKYPDTLLAGNIGKSVLDSLEFIDEKAMVVLELSSFQLEGFEARQVSPKFAVITNILPDHLNYYPSMTEYTAAKRVIVKYQSENDLYFINSDDQVTNSPLFLDGLKGKMIKFSSTDIPEDFKPLLPGDHNKANYAAALKIAVATGVDKAEALSSMNRFTGADFRLQKIYESGRLKIYNDSAATNPSATKAALKAFNNCILICGGVNKGLPFEELGAQIDRSCRAVYFLDGDATGGIKEFVKHRNILRSTYFDFDSLLKDLKIEAGENAVILFSPAAASFNMFKNEFDRGRKFNQAVERIFPKT